MPEESGAAEATADARGESAAELKAAEADAVADAGVGIDAQIRSTRRARPSSPGKTVKINETLISSRRFHACSSNKAEMGWFKEAYQSD